MILVCAAYYILLCDSLRSFGLLFQSCVFHYVLKQLQSHQSHSQKALLHRPTWIYSYSTYRLVTYNTLVYQLLMTDSIPFSLSTDLYSD